MLSQEEKREMLEDGRSCSRRNNFVFSLTENDIAKITFDDYISFLDSIQKIFSPFNISYDKTYATINKL